MEPWDRKGSVKTEARRDEFVGKTLGEAKEKRIAEEGGNKLFPIFLEF